MTTSVKKPKGYYSNNLESVRLGMGLTVNDFAFKVGKTSQTVYDWEQGTRGPDFESAQMIWAATGQYVHEIWASSWGKVVDELASRRKALNLS